MKICSFICQQPKQFPWKYGRNHKAHTEYLAELRQAVTRTVELNEITIFYCAMEHGSDLDFAEAVLYQKENNYHEIQLVCIVNSENQFKDWDKQDILRYNSILKRASVQYSFSPISLIDNSEQIIAVWNESETGEIWNNIKYVVERKKLVYYIRLNDIKADVDQPRGKLNASKQTLNKSLFTRIGYIILIEELIKQHPNPKAALQTAIQNNPAFENEITRLANILAIDLGIDK